MLSLLSPLIFSPLNRMRGGGFGPTAKLAGKNAYIVAVLLSAWIFLCTFNWMAALAFLVAYILGESMGWGKWLGSLGLKLSQAEYEAHPLGKREEGRKNGIHWLADEIAPEKKDYHRYARVALAIRGLYWGAPIVIALAATGAIHPISALIAAPLLAITFPLSYILAQEAFGEDYWPKGEFIYGFFQGSIIGTALWVGT